MSKRLIVLTAISLFASSAGFGGTGPVLALQITQNGTFAQGQTGATYTIAVTNTGDAAIQPGNTVEVDIHSPGALNAVSEGGTGWSFQNPIAGLFICTSSAGIPANGGTISSITITVNITSNAPASVMVSATASSTGASNQAMGSATFNISQASAGSPQWMLTETHTGNFTQGEIGTATITATNIGPVSSSGAVIVTALPPVGLTVASMSGLNWLCNCPTSCSRSDARVAGGAFEPITVTFNVAADAPSVVTDSASIQGGGAAQTGTTTDPTTILKGTPPPFGPPPFGSFDTPYNNSNVSGAIGVTGWALSPSGVYAVDVWREPNPGEAAASNGLVLIGTASFVPNARPDVQKAYPAYPNSNAAGWGLQILTNELPFNSFGSILGNGTYRLHAIAHSSADGDSDLGTRTIIVNNAASVSPFGTIDTPAQGGFVSGSSYVNFGWALTPIGSQIPTDGSTIWVYIDKAAVAHPVYNQYRSDVANTFPGLQNSGGPVGYYRMDTTKLTNGLHTLSWVVTDNLGHASGLGSRFINVQNACTPQ